MQDLIKKKNNTLAYIPFVLLTVAACVPTYAAGEVTDIFATIVDILKPIFEGLQKISWVIGAVAIAWNLISIATGGGNRNTDERVQRIKVTVAAVIGVNVVAWVLNYLSTQLASTSITQQDLGSLYSGFINVPQYFKGF